MSEEDEYIESEEYLKLVKEALRVMYVRGYHEALDDLLEVIKSGADLKTVLKKVQILRKLCNTSSATHQ